MNPDTIYNGLMMQRYTHKPKNFDLTFNTQFLYLFPLLKNRNLFEQKVYFRFLILYDCTIISLHESIRFFVKRKALLSNKVSKNDHRPNIVEQLRRTKQNEEKMSSSPSRWVAQTHTEMDPSHGPWEVMNQSFHIISKCIHQSTKDM